MSKGPSGNKGKAKVEKAPETEVLDPMTQSNVKKVQQALGETSPAVDIIVMYLRDNKNNVNNAVTNILDEEANGWTARASKKKNREEPKDVVPEVEKAHTAPKGGRGGSGGRGGGAAQSRAEQKKAELAKKELRYVQAQDATTVHHTGFNVQQAPKSTFSYLQAAKAPPAVQEAPTESTHGDYTNDSYTADHNNAPAPVTTNGYHEEPEEDNAPAPWRVGPILQSIPAESSPKGRQGHASPKQVTPSANAVQQPPQQPHVEETRSPVKAPQSQPAAPAPTATAAPQQRRAPSLELRMPMDIESAVDSRIVFRCPPPEAPKVQSPPRVDRKREEQSIMTDMVGVFSAPPATSPPAPQGTAPIQPQPTAPAAATHPTQRDVSTDPWATQPFSKPPPSQQQAASAAQPRMPQTRAWPNPPNTSAYAPNYGGYYQQQQQQPQAGNSAGGWNYPSGGNYAFAPPPPQPNQGGQGQRFPAGYTQGGFSMPHQGSNPALPPYNRGGGGSKGPGGVPGTFPYSVTGDESGHHRDGEGWNYNLK